MPAKDYLQFDEVEVALTSLDLLALVGALVRKTPSYWRWVIVAAHEALQGAMVCALGDTSGVRVLDKKCARKTLEGFDTQKDDISEKCLANFETLLAQCQENLYMDSERLALNTEQLNDINTLHEHYRNNLSYFTPTGWGIEKARLPRIVGTAIDCIEELMGKTQVLFKLTGNRKRRLSKNIKEIRALLAKL